MTGRGVQPRPQGAEVSLQGEHKHGLWIFIFAYLPEAINQLK
ncbi:hypothetical protein C900_01208 [Fulvivirga imtechensis AK7]|uniref:Uncharacterized protein n=1 Tax=Fulvivirga imtechensis AK7 TaxID=1237149 RepID=L8JKJ5_9BACT|nr:hypothetical protein C900_01208 [Fulvivirga imtechensis AK7]